MGEITKINSEILYEGRTFMISKDSVILEDGRSATRDVVHRKAAACVVPITEDGEVYLVRQFRYAVGRTLLEIPAGGVEEGEDPFESAKRELAEECGLVAEEYIDLNPHFPTVGYCNEQIFIWLARKFSFVPMHLDDQECLEPLKIPFSKAVAMVEAGEIQDGKTIIGLLKAKQWMEKTKI